MSMTATQEVIEAINKLLPPNLQIKDGSPAVDLWAALLRLYGDQVQGPKGHTTWKDAALAEVLRARGAGMTLDRDLATVPAARPCCPSCGTHEVSQQQTCHNSACEAYARDVTIYEGWHVQKSSRFAPEPGGKQETPRKLGADESGVAGTQREGGHD